MLPTVIAHDLLKRHLLLKLVLTALNTSKSAYASIAFAANRFFSKYQFAGVAQNRDKFFCKLYNRVRRVPIYIVSSVPPETHRACVRLCCLSFGVVAEIPCMSGRRTRPSIDAMLSLPMNLVRRADLLQRSSFGTVSSCHNVERHRCAPDSFSKG